MGSKSSLKSEQKQRLLLGIFSGIVLVVFLVVYGFSFHIGIVLFAILGLGNLAVYMYYRWRYASKNAQRPDGDSITGVEGKERREPGKL